VTGAGPNRCPTVADVLPAGATPLDPDEADGLIPDHVSTRAELNAWEQLNIGDAVAWLGRRTDVASLLTIEFVTELHRRMFSDTWRWAGRFRWTLKNIGVPPEAIVERTHDLLADTRYWMENGTYPADEIAVRFHHRLVSIHPFPNGNGRHGRLMTDALVREIGAPTLTWGSGSIDHQGGVRHTYIRALQTADAGDYAGLLAFVRS